jgi:hypothetical protein
VTRLTLLVFAGALLLVAIVASRRRREEMAMPRQDVSTPRTDDDGIDWEELERAEREVQELDHDGGGGAPEQAHGEDWGPGTSKPPLA